MLTIKDTTSKNGIAALKAYVQSYYADNVFMQSDFNKFFKLWLLVNEDAAWQKALEDDLRYYLIKKWLMSLFDENATKATMLEAEDLALLVLNNITTVPSCKKKLRKQFGV